MIFPDTSSASLLNSFGFRNASGANLVRITYVAMKHLQSPVIRALLEHSIFHKLILEALSISAYMHADDDERPNKIMLLLPDFLTIPK